MIGIQGCAIIGTNGNGKERLMKRLVGTACKTENIITGVLILLSLVAAVIKLFVGFDIDEAYAVAMPYRLCQMDILFRDMWEVHQTSSIFPFLFVWPFVRLTGGTTYLVLYLRCVATILHAAMAFLMYRFIHREYFQRTEEGRIPAILAGLIYFNMLPKWLISLDFSMQQIWFLTLLLVCLYYGHKNDKKIWFLGAGAALAMDVLAYPGMVLLFPVTLLLLLLDRNTAEKRKKIVNCLFFTAGCGILAVVFLTYIISKVGVTDFLKSIPYVFSDGTHQYDFATKLSVYGTQWLEVLIQSAILLVPSVILSILILLFTSKKTGKISAKRADKTSAVRADKTSAKRADVGKPEFLPVLILTFVTFSSALVIVAGPLGISWGPFRLQVRYLLMFFGALLLFVLRKTKGERWLLCLFVTVSFTAFAGILISSNVGPVSSSSYLVTGMILLLLLLFERFLHHRKVTFMVMALFVISLVMCKGFYVRVTEYPPANILESREMVAMGAAKGIYVYPEDKKRMEADYTSIQKETKEGETILFMGTEALNNLASGGRFVSPTTISTPAFNEQWREYFTIYPDKQPDIIFLAKNTVDDREKFFTKNPFGIWIADNYDVKNRTESESLCIIRRKK